MTNDKNEEKNLATKKATEAILTRAEFQTLAAVPAEVEWFANIDNRRTRRAYQIDMRDFMGFVGIRRPEEFRIITRAHVIAWRKHLEARELGGADHTAEARGPLLAL
jgi:hypothetical protein